MDVATARALCALNNEFYAREASSFSATREAPWPGWRRVLRCIVAAQGDEGISRGGTFASGCQAFDWRGEGGGDSRPSRIGFEACTDGAVPGSTASKVRGRASTLSVLDVACGNMRFERFLDAEYPGEFLSLAVDSCDRLALDALSAYVFERAEVSYTHIDAIERLLDGGVQGLAFSLGTKSADAAVGFGFMHHIPGGENRVNFIRALLETVRPGGIVAVSLWRFMDDERLAKKAREATDRAQSYVTDAVVGHTPLDDGTDCVLPDERAGRASLDEESARSPLFAIDFTQFEAGDYLLGWQNDTAAFRYCHSFSDEEIETLILSVGDRAHLIDRFTADGKAGNLNEYLVFCRK